MAQNSNDREEIDTLDGERGITSISENKSSSGNDELGKKLAVLGFIIFLGFVAYLQWPTEEEEPVEVVTESTRQIRTNSQFQPAEILEPEPEIIAEPEPEQESAPTGPIERIRIEEAQVAPEPTEAEILFESSKRAPMMAFEGSTSTSSGGSNTDSGGGGLFGSGGGEQQGSSGIASDLETTQLTGSVASVLQNPHLTITQGTMIPCALNTAMDSSQPGLVTCTITNDIYSTTGTVVLLEKGSRVVGQYRGGLQRGENRLFVIWTRAETPNGVIVTLDSAGTDSLGRSGLSGDVDTQFWTRFGGTLMLSIVDDALAAYAASNTNAETIENTSSGVSSLAQTELQSTINVPVIIRKNQGEEVAILVSRDLDFSSVYRLKAR